MNQKAFSWIFFIIIILVVVAIVIKNWAWISETLGLNKKCKDSDSNLQCVEKMGAVKSMEVGVGERYDYPKDPNNEYGFYSNNRAVRFADQKKGTYDKVKITFDDGSTITLKEVFSKK